MKTYKGLITRLEPNQVFVFGSNTEGRHGAGASRYAKQHFGAKHGIERGMSGQSYAIVTKNLLRTHHPSIPEYYIIEQIWKLYEIARLTPDKEFLVAYSGEGKNLNGYSPKQMAKMFGCMTIPDNMVFEEGFYKLMDMEHY